jgi:hypothetical protein
MLPRDPEEAALLGLPWPPVTPLAADAEDARLRPDLTIATPAADAAATGDDENARIADGIG